MICVQSLGDRDAKRMRPWNFFAVARFLHHRLRLLSLHSCKSPIERAPSTAPSIASRCFAQKSPRLSTGSVHGIQRSGETLDGTNAAQWVSLTENLT
jgi:hypothetical protein